MKKLTSLIAAVVVLVMACGGAVLAQGRGNGGAPGGWHGGGGMPSGGWHGGGHGAWYGPSVGVYFGGIPYGYYPYAGYYPYPYYPSPYYPYPSYYPYQVYAAPPMVYIEKPPPRTAAIPPAPRRERYTLSAQELFAFDHDNLRLPQPKLDEIASALISNPQIKTVTITGYTDRLGSDSYNEALSQRRADTVKGYLVGRGVAASRLIAVGKGKANPVVQCAERDKSALIKCLEPNRRVEVEHITIEHQIG
jgi:outer membrane protein OmpA-like peptidoglycan-associated protein